MALARARREGGMNYWPGFVDALSTLILGIIFLLSVFVVVQFYLTQEVTGKDTALNRLNAQIAQLTELLSLEKTGKLNLEAQLAQIRSTLTTAGAAPNTRVTLESVTADPSARGARGAESSVREGASSRRAMSARRKATADAGPPGKRRVCRSACSDREPGREATQLGIEAGVVDRFPLNDQEVLVRHFHHGIHDWVGKYQREHAKG